MSDFNDVADNYNDIVNEALMEEQRALFHGSDHEYFNQYKMFYLKPLFFDSSNVKKEIKILDYGCGVGILSSMLGRTIPAAVIHGFDISEKSIADVPKAMKESTRFRFTNNLSELDNDYGFSILSTVLHHVPLVGRSEVLSNIYQRLKVGGKIIIIEHNMKNPLTRQTVKACSFDDDAIMMNVPEVKKLLLDAGYKNIQSRYIVFFPKMLSGFRFIDRCLTWCPIGAQFLVWGEK